jgi:hypothetical protein
MNVVTQGLHIRAFIAGRSQTVWRVFFVMGVNRRLTPKSITTIAILYKVTTFYLASWSPSCVMRRHTGFAVIVEVEGNDII